MSLLLHTRDQILSRAHKINKDYNTVNEAVTYYFVVQVEGTQLIEIRDASLVGNDERGIGSFLQCVAIVNGF